jgi:hypothetical protein
MPGRSRSWSPSASVLIWLLVLLTGLLLPRLAAGQCGGPEWISLEIIAGEIAGAVAVERVEIDADGCTRSHYPVFDRRAGTFDHHLGATQRALLADVLVANRILEFDAARERAALLAAEMHRAKRAGGEVHYVADADLYRLRIVQHGREHVIEWPAPELELEQRGAVPALQRLAAVTRAVREAGEQARRSALEAAR